MDICLYLLLTKIVIKSTSVNNDFYSLSLYEAFASFGEEFGSTFDPKTQVRRRNVFVTKQLLNFTSITTFGHLAPQISVH